MATPEAEPVRPDERTLDNRWAGATRPQGADRKPLGAGAVEPMATETQLTVRTLFAPEDDTTGAFLAFVAQAQRSIHILIYGYHLPGLTDDLIAKHQAGLEVRLLLDHSQAEGRAESGEVQRLVAASLDVVVGTSPVQHQILHSKFTVIDRAWVEDGSWNYSLSAPKQANTMNFIRDPGRAAEFLAHWETLRAWILADEPQLQA